MVAGQKFLEGLRSLPSYKDAQQKQLRALLKQLGSVTDLSTGQSGKILSMLDEKLWDHESLQQLRQQRAAGCTTGRERSPLRGQPAGWLADLGNEPRLARGRDVHSCGCPDVFDPAGASCRSGRTARLAGNCTAGDVGCAPAAADFVLRCTKTACSPLSAVVRRCPPLSVATDTLCDVRRCPRKPRICSLRRWKPCPRCPRTTKRCVSVRKHLSAMSAALKYMIFCLSAASHELLLMCGSFASGCPVSGYVFWWYL